ncbi:MAG: FeoB-associated Cys-rich membrane protein [Prevotellaceae bacterium]|nr:FeoB-associated Cys-rich membrane protein [Candidatus Faecinaster equi]
MLQNIIVIIVLFVAVLVLISKIYSKMKGSSRCDGDCVKCHKKNNCNEDYRSKS